MGTRRTNVEVLVAGAGFVGQALAKQLAERDWDWRAVRRSSMDWGKDSTQQGQWIVADFDEPGDCTRLAGLQARRWVYLAPAAERRTGVDHRLRGILAALAAHPPEQFVYASTTGVYGNQDGAVVNENSPLRAETERAKVRVDAERAVQEFATEWGCGWSILRLPGIYGPGRLRLDAIAAGTPVLCPELAPPGNRVHRDDIVSAIMALLEHREIGNGIFNLADQEHATSTEFVYAVADAICAPRPPCMNDLEQYYQQFPGMASFLRERRRIDSTRAREVLGWLPRYDTIAAGITASL